MAQSQAQANEFVNSAQDAGAKAPALEQALVARSEFLYTAGALAVLAGLIVSLPGKAIDVLLVFNLSLTAALVVIALSAKRPAELGGFALLVIFTTLMRLAAGAAVSRAILLQGWAGAIVSTTGGLLVGTGRVRPGVVLFLAAAAIIFGLVWKLAQGIRKSALRFVTEIMPVRKLGVETDLNAGLIDNLQGQELNEKINCQGRFFAAMTGAGRFIFFDAVITLILISVNITAGLALACMDVPIGSMPGQVYAGLAVGAGLIAQLPGLVVALASRSLLNKQFFKIGADGGTGQAEGPLSVKVVSSEQAGRQMQTTAAGNAPRFCEILEQKKTHVEKDADFEPLQDDQPRENKPDTAKKSAQRDNFYDGLAEQIEAVGSEKAGTILLAASTTAQLGVTTAVNIAARVARKEQRCLLVDTDAKRNAVAKVFELGGESPAGGLKVPAKTCIDNLWVWPGENFAQHNIMTLSQKIGQLSRKFHRIIIYAPNILEASAACEQLAGCMQVAMLFDSQDSSENVSMGRLRERLKASGCEIFEPMMNQPAAI